MRLSKVLLVFSFLLVALVSYAAGRASVKLPPPPGVDVKTTDLQVDLGGLDNLTMDEGDDMGT